MGKRVKQVMTSNPCAIESTKPVSYAAKMMKDENIGLAPIVEGDMLIGALTDRDIVTRVVAEGRTPARSPRVRRPRPSWSRPSQSRTWTRRCR